MSRWRWIRFSLRVMLGTITLICVFLAGWEICKQRAVADVKMLSGGQAPRIVAPYLLRIEKSDNVTVTVTYHIWCFGMVCHLPYSPQFPETGGFFSVVRPRIIYQEEPELLGILPTDPTGKPYLYPSQNLSMFVVVTHGLPYTMKEMPPDIRKVRRHEIIARIWEDEHLFDPESQYRFVPTDVPELTSFQRFLARTVHNPIVTMKGHWERIGNYNSDALVAVVQKGLANDDDIIQQWFDGPQVIKLLSSAKNWKETLLAVEAIGGGHEDTPEVASYVKRILRDAG